MSKFSRWSGRLGTPNQHNASLPRDFWLEDWEKAAIIAFHALYPLEGYRRLAYMMLDADVVAVSPSSVYRVLRAAGKLAPRGGKPSKKGQGFEQPLRPHEHWHIDVSYLNVCGTFFFLCSILDGYSRFVIHWEIRETMKEAEVGWLVARRPSGPRGERNWQGPMPGDEPSPRRRSLLGHSPLSYIEGAWAEDRATRGRDPSADPGPRPERAAGSRPTAVPGLARKR